MCVSKSFSLCMTYQGSSLPKWRVYVGSSQPGNGCRTRIYFRYTLSNHLSRQSAILRYSLLRHSKLKGWSSVVILAGVGSVFFGFDFWGSWNSKMKKWSSSSKTIDSNGYRVYPGGVERVNINPGGMRIFRLINPGGMRSQNWIINSCILTDIN